MQIENRFTVAAPPDRVFAHLLDVNSVVRCVPGAELSEVVDPTTFRGKVKIKVGPVSVAYDGTAHITERDDTARIAVLEADGRERGGQGSARATTRMAVTEDGEGSAVVFTTDVDVVGRVAQFGKGLLEDVSKRLVGQTADCIRASLEAPPAPEPAPVDAGAGHAGGDAPVAPPPRSDPAGAAAPALPQAPAEIDAGALALGVAGDRVRRHAPQLIVAAIAALLMVILRRRRRRRRR